MRKVTSKFFIVDVSVTVTCPFDLPIPVARLIAFFVTNFGHQKSSQEGLNNIDRLFDQERTHPKHLRRKNRN